MNQRWLFRLAPLLFAALPFATPQVATAAELNAAAPPHGLAPRLELNAQAVCARVESYETRTAALVPAACRHAVPAGDITALPATRPSCDVPRSTFAARQPPARAPPRS